MSLRRERQPRRGEAVSLSGTVPWAAAPLLLGCLAVSLVRDPGARPLLFYCSMAVAFLSFVGCLWWWSRTGVCPTWRQMLFVAVVARLFFLSLPPTLSDDIYRYLWDGRVTVAGINPYAHSPDSDRLASLREGPWERVWQQTAHRDVETVYPPVALGVFSIAALLPAPLLSYKLILVALDLLGCVLLIRLAERIGVSSSGTAGRTAGRLAALAYVWNPLVLLEVAGMGHIDGAGLAPVALAVSWLVPSTEGPRGSRGWLASAVAAAVAVLVKLVPLVALGFWALRSGRAWRYLGVVALLLVVCVGPLLVALGGAPPGLVTYGMHWEFNGPLYEPLWRLIDGLDVEALTKRGFDRLKEATGAHEFWNGFYSYIYPQFLAKVALAGGLGLWLLGVLLRTERDPVRGTARIFAATLMAIATVYPWYLLWLLPWSALERSRAVLLLSATLLLAYLPLLSGVDYFPWVWLVVWGPPGLVALVCTWQRRTPANGRSEREVSS